MFVWRGMGSSDAKEHVFLGRKRRKRRRPVGESDEHNAAVKTEEIVLCYS